MKIKTASRSTLFLMEFIVVVFFLILTIGVSVGLFVKSHEVATRSKDAVYGALIAQSIAEEILSGKESESLRYFNKEGEEVPQGIFLVTVENQIRDGMNHYQIEVLKNQVSIYDLEVQQYFPGEVKE